MIRVLLLTSVVCCPSLTPLAHAQEKQAGEKAPASVPAAPPPAPQPDSTTTGTVTVNGHAIAYRAVAGTLTVGATESQDASLGFDGKLLPDSGEKAPDPSKPEEAPPTARMFYAAYFRQDAPSETRPITFL